MRPRTILVLASKLALVAGVAALVNGAHGRQMDPTPSRPSSAPPPTTSADPGLDPRYGHGRVNAAGAVALK